MKYTRKSNDVEAFRYGFDDVPCWFLEKDRCDDFLSLGDQVADGCWVVRSEDGRLWRVSHNDFNEIYTPCVIEDKE